MQVTETVSDGLKREIKVTVPADELAQRVDQRLAELKGQVRLKGFRPGKVPVGHLKKIYGRSVMAEVLEKTVGEKTQQAIEERNERPALQPDVKLTEDQEEIEKVMAGDADLAYSVAFEILPDIELIELAKLELERPVAEPPDSQIDEALAKLQEQGTSYEVEEERAAEEKDRLSIDFTGRIDGEEFEGGSGQDVFVVIGRGGFIAGFEEGLTGAKTGEERDVTAQFPEDYHAEDLAGKEAVFSVTVKDVARPVVPELDDAFAEQLGLESYEKLREAVTERTKQEYETLSRNKLKRSLLDALSDGHAFELPPTLVDNEFDGIWRQIEQSLAESEKTFEDEGKTEEEARKEYREIAERRVRLGLVLSEIGEKNEISISDEELGRAMVEQARRYPGREKEMYELMRSTPEMVMQLRAPLYEDKVVDFILELANVTEKTVTPDELLAVNDEEDDDVGAGAST